MIAVERFSAEKHYDTVCTWWVAQGWPKLPLSHLSPLGLVVTNDGVPAACAFIYETKSAYCLLEWIVASPDVRKETRASVLSVLISTAKLLCKSLGFETIFLTVNNQSLASRLESHGFKDCGKATNYQCNLGGN